MGVEWGFAKTLFGRPKEYSRITAKPTPNEVVIVEGRCHRLYPGSSSLLTSEILNEHYVVSQGASRNGYPFTVG